MRARAEQRSMQVCCLQHQRRRQGARPGAQVSGRRGSADACMWIRALVTSHRFTERTYAGIGRIASYYRPTRDSTGEFLPVMYMYWPQVTCIALKLISRWWVLKPKVYWLIRYASRWSSDLKATLRAVSILGWTQNTRCHCHRWRSCRRPVGIVLLDLLAVVSTAQLTPTSVQLRLRPPGHHHPWLARAATTFNTPPPLVSIVRDRDSYSLAPGLLVTTKVMAKGYGSHSTLDGRRHVERLRPEQRAFVRCWVSIRRRPCSLARAVEPACI